jgi:hypothetical protein
MVTDMHLTAHQLGAHFVQQMRQLMAQGRDESSFAGVIDAAIAIHGPQLVQESLRLAKAQVDAERSAQVTACLMEKLEIEKDLELLKGFPEGTTIEKARERKVKP